MVCFTTPPKNKKKSFYEKPALQKICPIFIKLNALRFSLCRIQSYVQRTKTLQTIGACNRNTYSHAGINNLNRLQQRMF